MAHTTLLNPKKSYPEATPLPVLLTGVSVAMVVLVLDKTLPFKYVALDSPARYSFQF